MHLESNPQLELAYEYVNYTNKSIFLTGKAGTGKTTFLHRIKNEPVKRMVVVAPTGVAAINAGGMTIHSFFQLPFGPFLPGNTRDAARQRRFSGKKIELIRSLDLLVIDEISMVRADLLDGVDEVLRRYKNPLQPFGGVQLLLIGDLHQLPPVVKGEEWDLLRTHYDTPYFFSSQALRKAKPVVVELKHIYRQSDGVFINLLNKVRNNRIDAEVLTTLNSRYIPRFQPREEDGYITLTTHNASAQTINSEKLQAISTPAHTFRATITGDFPEHAYPTDEVLELKTGAQVMFVKNDPSYEKSYYNGKIGKITRIKDDVIYVKCPDDVDEISVEPLDWNNVKYTLNEQTREVAEDIIGTFTQYPLKLAWAITIHKSQGLTFERVILDAQAAFAHGQVYVALSRCKSFEGIVLHSQIVPSSVKTDATVKNYTEEAEKNAPDEAQLERDKIAFQQSLLLELFGFDALKKDIEKMNRVLLEHEHKLHPGAPLQFKTLCDLAEAHLFSVSAKFRGQIQRLIAQGGLPEANEALQDRVRKGSAWFVAKLEDELRPAANAIQILSDNRKIRKEAREVLEKLQKELFVKQACFLAARNGFSTHEYLRLKANAELDFKSAQFKSIPASELSEAPPDTPHPELYLLLQRWREAAAEAEGRELYSILPTKSLVELVQYLPLSKDGLKKITGIGKGRIRQFGVELLAIIQTYCTENDITSPLETELARKKMPKPDSKSVSFELFRTGKSIDEIAAERGLVRSTIEGHLSHFISQGELSIYDLMDKADVGTIEDFVAAHPNALLSEVKEHFGETYTYGQIRMVMTYLRVEMK